MIADDSYTKYIRQPKSDKVSHERFNYKLSWYDYECKTKLEWTR